MVKRIILASASPRRQQLLADMGVGFETHVLPDISEDYPDGLSVKDIAEYIAREKAAAYQDKIGADEVLITADTTVIVDDAVLGKPHDRQQALDMLRMLSGRTHQVITGVALLTEEGIRSFSDTTDVTFRRLTDVEIAYYVDNYRPYDKAGAYGIQEWIGLVGISSISGSYFNVMGLPVHRLYEALTTLTKPEH